MSDPYSSLPEPAPLRRAALVEYQWGETQFEIICTACSVRTVEWQETGEQVTWLHCKAMPTAELKPEGPTGMMTVLIPTRYITSIKPGRTFRIARGRKTKDTGIFPPNQPTPKNNLALAEIESVIADLLAPERN